MSEPRGGTSRAIPWVVAGVVLAVLVAAAVLAATGSPQRRPAGSPEATVQDYFEALQDRRRGDLSATFTDELAEQCPLPTGDLFYGELSRVATSAVSIDGDRAEVRVSITERYGSGILDSSENTFDETIVLEDGDDGWRIAEAPWPYLCGFKEPR